MTRTFHSLRTALRAVVVGQASAEVEGDFGVNTISVIAVDTADNQSVPGTTTLNL